MTNPDTVGPCIVCGKSDSPFCNRCKNARYCSKACQRTDWPTHKLLCAAYSIFDVSSRPTSDHVRAILFPVDEEKPKLIWFHCEWHDDDDGGRHQYPDKASVLGSDVMLKDMTIQYNPILKKRLSDTIFVGHRDTFLVDGSKPNKSIQAIVSTKTGLYHDWRGPIVAYGKEGLGIDPVACRDLNMNDFRHVTDFFFTYNSEPDMTPKPSQDSVFPKVKGVRVNCIGDEKMLNKPHFEAIDVPLTDSIFSKHHTSDITKRIGLPIFTRRCLPNPKWTNEDENPAIFGNGSPYNNQDATFLHLSLDPDTPFDPSGTGSMGWGFASHAWQRRVGSAIIVRQDRKPLLPLHAEALCRYCRLEISPFISHSIGEYAPEEPMTKDAVLAMVCRPSFVIYWYKLQDEKRKVGEDWDFPSPYEV